MLTFTNKNVKGSENMAKKDRGWEYLNSGNSNEFDFDPDGDGSWGIQNGDGSDSYYGADGSWGYRNSDGSASYYGNDGSWGYRNSDGSGSFYEADGDSEFYNATEEDDDDEEDDDTYDISSGIEAIGTIIGLAFDGISRIRENGKKRK